MDAGVVSNPLVLAQLVMGLVLRRLRGPTRLQLQRVHFWTMVALLTLTTGHVLLNGPFIGATRVHSGLSRCGRESAGG
jgi:hypothetical protein